MIQVIQCWSRRDRSGPYRYIMCHTTQWSCGYMRNLISCWHDHGKPGEALQCWTECWVIACLLAPSCCSSLLTITHDLSESSSRAAYASCFMQMHLCLHHADQALGGNGVHWYDTMDHCVCHCPVWLKYTMQVRHIACTVSVLCPTSYSLSNKHTCNQQVNIITALGTQVQWQNAQACLRRQTTTGLTYKVSHENNQWAKEKKGHL